VDWNAKYGCRTGPQAGNRFLGSLKGLQIQAQATMASRNGSLESIPRLHNMKNEDEDDFLLIEAKKYEYILTLN
jgi:hypothetical protein